MAAEQQAVKAEQHSREMDAAVKKLLEESEQREARIAPWREKAERLCKELESEKRARKAVEEQACAAAGVAEAALAKRDREHAHALETAAVVAESKRMEHIRT